MIKTNSNERYTLNAKMKFVPYPSNANYYIQTRKTTPTKSKKPSKPEKEPLMDPNNRLTPIKKGFSQRVKEMLKSKFAAR